MIVVTSLVLICVLGFASLLCLAFFVEYWLGVAVVMGLAVIVAALASTGYYLLYVKKDPGEQ